MTIGLLLDTPALPLLLSLERDGFDLEVTDDGRLRVSPRNRLDEEHVAAIQHHKDALKLLVWRPLAPGALRPMLALLDRVALGRWCVVGQRLDTRRGEDHRLNERRADAHTLTAGVVPSATDTTDNRDITKKGKTRWM